MLRKHVHPHSSGTSIEVETVTDVHNWHTLLHVLHLGIHGHTISVSGESVNHAFRLVRRQDILQYQQRKEWTAPFADAWQEYQENDEDIILLLKNFMSSLQLSQQPMWLVPIALAKECGNFPAYTMERKRFPSHIQTEFLKTAKRIAKIPWCLDRAAEWLEHLVDDNINARAAKPVPATNLPLVPVCGALSHEDARADAILMEALQCFAPRILGWIGATQPTMVGKI